MRDTTKTKVCYAETVKNPKDGTDTKKLYITTETAWNKIVKEATEAKEAVPEMISTQTFGYKFSETVEEAVGLSGGIVNLPPQSEGEPPYFENIEVFLTRHNYAESLAQDNEANDILQGDNFQAQEGVFDVSYAIAQKTERKKMSNEEVALNALAKGGINISLDELKAMLADVLAKRTAAVV